MTVGTKNTAAQVIVEVMRQVDVLRKTRRTEQQGKYLFRGIDEVMNLVGPALREAGGFITPTVLEKSHETMGTAAGGLVNLIRLTVRYDVYGLADLVPVSGVVAAESFDSGDKATAKAMSVAYRTFLLQLLTLPTETPDPDESGFERGHEQTGRTIAQDVSVSLGQQFKSVTDAKEFVETVLGHEAKGDVATWDESDIQALQVALETRRLADQGEQAREAAERYKATIATQDGPGAIAGNGQSSTTPKAAKDGYVVSVADVERIALAAGLDPSNTFLVDIAAKFIQYHCLTKSQTESALKQAGRVLDQPRVLTPVGDEWPPDEERF